MSGSWAASMQASLLAALARPAWWALALAAFLVRGGFLICLLPIVSLPTTAALTNALAPTIEDLIIGGPSLETVLAGTLAHRGCASWRCTALAFAGSWLDLALLREATSDEELDLGWSPANRSATLALAIRLVAHLPTVVAIGYAGLRIIDVAVPRADVARRHRDAVDPARPRAARPTPARGRDHVAPRRGRRRAGGAARRGGRAGRGCPRAVDPAGRRRRAASRRSRPPRWRSSRCSCRTSSPSPPRGRTSGPACSTVSIRSLTLAALVLMVSTWVLGLALLGALPRLARDGLDRRRSPRASGDRHAADAPGVGTVTRGPIRPLLHSRRSRGPPGDGSDDGGAGSPNGSRSSTPSATRSARSSTTPSSSWASSSRSSTGSSSGSPRRTGRSGTCSPAATTRSRRTSRRRSSSSSPRSCSRSPCSPTGSSGRRSGSARSTSATSPRRRCSPRSRRSRTARPAIDGSTAPGSSARPAGRG